MPLQHSAASRPPAIQLTPQNRPCPHTVAAQGRPPLPAAIAKQIAAGQQPPAKHRPPTQRHLCPQTPSVTHANPAKVLTVQSKPPNEDYLPSAGHPDSPPHESCFLKTQHQLHRSSQFESGERAIPGPAEYHHVHSTTAARANARPPSATVCAAASRAPRRAPRDHSPQSAEQSRLTTAPHTAGCLRLIPNQSPRGSHGCNPVPSAAAGDTA